MDSSAQWYGTFASSCYAIFGCSFVKGSFRFNINMDVDETTCPIAMTYTGSYRHGQQTTGYLHKKGETLHVIVEDMSIDFILEKVSTSHYRGKYNITSPKDHGSFQLFR